jgi:hypothetical protein
LEQGIATILSQSSLLQTNERSIGSFKNWSALFGVFLLGLQ